MESRKQETTTNLDDFDSFAKAFEQPMNGSSNNNNNNNNSGSAFETQDLADLFAQRNASPVTESNRQKKANETNDGSDIGSALDDFLHLNSEQRQSEEHSTDPKLNNTIQSIMDSFNSAKK